ncbi:MAG: hypothetical protein LBQ79_13660 [Deltaproteobacteria bacterium]|jgi:hypothetical protein|nr:hypothetical protein [Deltaproteobacteria bacterium]
MFFLMIFCGSPFGFPAKRAPAGLSNSRRDMILFRKAAACGIFRKIKVRLEISPDRFRLMFFPERLPFRQAHKLRQECAGSRRGSWFGVAGEN